MESKIQMMFKKGKVYKAVIKSLNEVLASGMTINENGFICNSEGLSLYGLRPDNPYFGKKLSVMLTENSIDDIMPWRVVSRMHKYDGYSLPHSFLNKVYE